MAPDAYDAVQDARSEARSEWGDGDTADDAAEAFRWGYGQAGSDPDSGRDEQ